VYVAADEDDRRHRDHRAAGRRERPGLVERAARRLPPRPLRSGPVVAFLGPDGAGKGLVIAALRERVPVAVTTGYLGVGPGRPRSRPASVQAVHTGPRPDAAGPAGPPPGGSRDEPTVPVVPQLRLREIAFLGRKWLRTLPTFVRAYRSAWRGHVVLLDRHPLDALAVRPRRSRWGARWERLLAVHLTPHPDAVVVLDAPGAVLFARKGEHSPGLLETWRQGYLDLERADLDTDVHVVDATRPPEAVVAEVSRLVWRQLARRRRWADA
jgi:thymidylate kinase